MAFYINKKKKQNTLHGPLNANMPSLDFHLRGLAAVNIVSISNISEFSPRGGGQNFSIISDIQKVLNYPGGRGSSLIGNFSQIFPFFFSDGSP